MIDYFDELTERISCSVYIGVGGNVRDYETEKEEYDRISEGHGKYMEQLLAAYKSRDTMLRLSELNCEEIYEHYPMIASFDLKIDDGELSGEEKAVRDKAVQDRVLEMIQAIQSETDDACNLEIEVFASKELEGLYDGARSWQYYILQGKQLDPEEDQNVSYEFAHAYAYEGIYW